MDTTKQNILMCEKAIGVQRSWVPQKGDWYYAEGGEVNVKSRYGYSIYIDELKVGEGRIFLYGNNYGDGYHHPNDMEYNKRIWLPRQDQLQEMYGTVGKNTLWRFCKFVFEPPNVRKYCHQFTSIEQLWLAFIMKEKYSKIWNGKDWTKIKNKENYENR